MGLWAWAYDLQHQPTLTHSTSLEYIPRFISADITQLSQELQEAFLKIFTHIKLQALIKTQIYITTLQLYENQISVYEFQCSAAILRADWVAFEEGPGQSCKPQC